MRTLLKRVCKEINENINDPATLMTDGKINVHYLKIESKYFHDVFSGCKKFEIRFDDRGYSEGDFLLLRDWYRDEYTGNYLIVRVSYLSRFIPGYVVMQFPRIVCGKVGMTLFNQEEK